MNTLQIAIDGPAGAGKSTIAKLLAKKLNIVYLDTGAMYRALTLHAREMGVDAADDAKLEKLLSDFDLKFVGDSLLLGGADISSAIRTPEIDSSVSAYAANPFIRAELVKLQRAIAADIDVVMEGRDIGTVVLADTPYKFYLDASPEERARRRMEQNSLRGIPSDFEAIKADIIRRDYSDMHRAADPLTIAPDAIRIDSSDMSIDQVVDYIIKCVDEKK